MRSAAGVVARGVVRFWHDEDGWGVIDSNATPGGCWVHYSALDMVGFHTLVAGQQVVFTWEQVDQDGYRHRAVVRP